MTYLGELSPSKKKGRAELVRRLENIPDAIRQACLFESEGAGVIDESVPEHVDVCVRNVRLERKRGFGDVWLAWILWRALGFDRLFAELRPAGKEVVEWARSIFVLVAGRLCSPGGERHLCEEWFPRTSLPDWFGISTEEMNLSRCYRTLDVLLPPQRPVESHLKARWGELFQVEFEVLLYDITSTFFEGAAEGNPQAQRGYSRDGRPDCKQVCIALIVNRDGIPMAHRVFDGNRTDVTTVEEIVAEIEGEFGKANRIWVMDRGMVSEKNLAFLRDRGGRYVVGTPKSMLKRFERAFAEGAWREVRPGLDVKLCETPDGTETFVLCKSADRREKEQAMFGRFRARIEVAPGKLRTRLESARKKLDRGKVERQLGRLLARNSRAGGLFEIRLEDVPKSSSGLGLSWSIKQDVAEWQELSAGAYLLRTNVNGLTAEELWRTYIQLTEAEEAFRTVKSDLEIRPVWHQTDTRVRAHIFVAFLAYVLWKTLQKWMERAGLGSSVRPVLEEIRRITWT